jgi:hypothetical protein
LTFTLLTGTIRKGISKPQGDRMTMKPNENSDKDSLKELEELLENDVMSVDDDDDRLIPKRELPRIIMRISVFFILALILFLAGFIDDIGILLVAMAILGLVEGFNIWRMKRSGKNKIQFLQK